MWANPLEECEASGRQRWDTTATQLLLKAHRTTSTEWQEHRSTRKACCYSTCIWAYTGVPDLDVLPTTRNCTAHQQQDAEQATDSRGQRSRSSLDQRLAHCTVLAMKWMDIYSSVMKEKMNIKVPFFNNTVRLTTCIFPITFYAISKPSYENSDWTWAYAQDFRLNGPALWRSPGALSQRPWVQLLVQLKFSLPIFKIAQTFPVIVCSMCTSTTINNNKKIHCVSQVHVAANHAYGTCMVQI